MRTDAWIVGDVLSAMFASIIYTCIVDIITAAGLLDGHVDQRTIIILLLIIIMIKLRILVASTEREKGGRERERERKRLID